MGQSNGQADSAMQKKRIAILGSTGSIGRQTVDVIRMHPDLMEAVVLVANRSVELLASQARELLPDCVVIADESLRPQLAQMLEDLPIKVYGGAQAIEEAVQADYVDVVVAAMVGFSGFGPTMAAIRAHKTIALANKETLVVAGEIVMEEARRCGVSILPVDSEHSAIFQCLNGERHLRPRKIILTASGGPFRGMSYEDLQHVTPAMALKHPNWNMGAKVTIDSASMMNKGLEAIEARWLFKMPASQIEIVVHPQSIVHSMVEWEDGAIKAQLGTPDMRLPIQYALTFPMRMPSPAAPIDWGLGQTLTFEKPDLNVFRNLRVALESLDEGGNVPCIMNAANEIAVASFIAEQISFTDITNVVSQTISLCPHKTKPTMQDLYDTDAVARQIASEQCKKLQK